MKKSLLFIPFLFILLSGCDTLSQVAQSTVQQYGNPTSLEIGNGLKQALEIGTGKSSDQLSTVDGFFANAAIKILFPPEAQMTIQDVTNILLGRQDAATEYFKRTTTLQLSASFKPVIQASLNKVGATKYYGDAATAYNKVPFVTKLNPDISDYVMQKAIDSLFVEIAKEELNIRQNLSARTTPLLQKVFGYYDKNKR
jgi:hypothetical protein